jgi:hypothetical protein
VVRRSRSCLPLNATRQRAERFLSKALGGSRVFHTNEQTGYLAAIVRIKPEEVLKENSRWGAWRTIAGYEPIHMIRKAKRPKVC